MHVQFMLHYTRITSHKVAPLTAPSWYRLSAIVFPIASQVIHSGLAQNLLAQLVKASKSFVINNSSLGQVLEFLMLASDVIFSFFPYSSRCPQLQIKIFLLFVNLPRDGAFVSSFLSRISKIKHSDQSNQNHFHCSTLH
jgi:hypothetical protein